MSGKKNKEDPGRKVVADNRKARHEYFIEESFEAGIALTGTEVKSLREGRASIGEAHAGEKDGDIWLWNAHIPPYSKASPAMNHEPRRPRRLLLKAREIKHIIGTIQQQGLTLIALDIHFNARGLAKLNLAICKGKKLHDKRETIRQREWGRQKGRLLRDKG
jgi:SsrA-binding protein